MKQLLEFARMLRDVGMGVALSEVVDAKQGLELVGLPEPGALHFRILRTCLVKRAEDQPVFAVVYNIFYDTELMPNRLEQEETSTAVVASGSGVQAGGLPTLARAILSGDFTPCSNNIGEAVTGVSGKHGDIQEEVRRALVSLDYFEAMNKLRLAEARGEIADWEYQQAVDQNAGDFLRLLEQEIIKQRMTMDLDWSEAATHLDWHTKSFNLLNQAEMGLVKKCLQKIGQKLAVRTGFREKPASCGRLNFRKTIGKAIATGGACVNLVYGRRYPEKPELVLLCDVSNSVYQFTGFMLQLIAAFRQRFDKVQAYVFVDRLWRVPNEVLRQDVAVALADIREKNRCSATGLSDFGQVFCEFYARVLPALPAKTVLLILGDGKNNWRPLELNTFKEITGKMNKVFWLNPLPKEQWGQEDCKISKYAPFCNAVFECGSLAQLEQVAMKIL